MRIVFLCRNQDITVGSYRIWIHDLHKTLTELGIDAIIADPSYDYRLIEKDDIIILSKGDADLCHRLREEYPKNLLGIINLGAENKSLPIDFVIVGSLEEADSLSQYKTIFYPLIERIFENIPIKVHEPASNLKKLKLCYHGHLPHLAKFKPNIKTAIEELNKYCPVELKIISAVTDIKWDGFKPEIENISYSLWDINTIAQEIQDCDIGIVPNITDYSEEVRHDTSDMMGLYETDYCFRFKNKSNAGRCFVFHQLGIPVIADLTPSNFHIMGDNKNGYLAMSKNGWLKAFHKLADPEHRNEIAKNAKSTFESLYNPKDWAKRMVNELRGMLDE